jgi:3-oxoacyl-[acyl-carrier protein] reductase
MVCLITGSSRGLGKSIALAFGKRGHKVAVHYREKIKKAEEVASQINGSIIVQSDNRNFASIKNAVEKIIEKWGRIDILINNAGVTKEALLLKTAERDFDDVLAVNLKGPFYFMRAALPYMARQENGHIMNIASIAGLKGKAGLSAYSASKAGLIGLTKTAAVELGKYNVMVNAVLPGYLFTDMGAASNSRAKETVLRESVINEYSNPARVAEFICFLSATSGITGQIFNLDSRII